MRCWWCGAEPIEVVEESYDICTVEQVAPVRTISHSWVRWPEGDHTHAERAPTAEELAQQAYAMLNQRVA